MKWCFMDKVDMIITLSTICLYGCVTLHLIKLKYPSKNKIKIKINLIYNIKIMIFYLKIIYKFLFKYFIILLILSFNLDVSF